MFSVSVFSPALHHQSDSTSGNVTSGEDAGLEGLKKLRGMGNIINNSEF